MFTRRPLAFVAPLLTFALAVLCALAWNEPASAGFDFHIKVNTTVDEDTPNSFCSFREAIVTATTNTNYNGCAIGALGDDTHIDFNIGSGTPFIDIGSNLPLIADPVIINGNTGGATRVELRGPGSGQLSGLVLDAMAAGSQINRLVINGYPGGNAILVGAANVTLTGNYIGTDATGTSSPFNTLIGVQVTGAGVHIGGPNGTTPGGSCTGDCNLLSGNTFEGIRVENPGINALIEGNFVGTDVTGTAVIGNGLGMVVIPAGGVVGGLTSSRRNVVSGYQTGISINSNVIVEGNFVGTDTTGTVRLEASGGSVGVRASTEANGAVIGGTAPGAGNLISSNAIGVNLFGADNTAVLGNTLGTGVNGDEFLPNVSGVVALGAFNNTIGGTGPGEANTIQSSISSAVLISGQTPSTGNSIRGNSIFSSGSKGIDNADGGNNELAPPVINSVGVLAAGNGVSGTACVNCEVDVYSDDEDEGRIYEGTVTASGTGDWTFNANVAGPHVTATANDAAGNTSEFSEPFTVPVATPTPSPTPSPTPTASPAGPVLVQGDVTCDGVVDIEDFVVLIGFAAGVDDGTMPGDCPDLGGAMPAGGLPDFWGDVNCDDRVDARDALAVLAFPDIELPHPGCRDIGQVL